MIKQFKNKTKSELQKVEMRLQNDLIEMKKYRMTTNMFNTKYSHIIINEDNNLYNMYISIEKNKIEINVTENIKILVFDAI